MGWLLSLLAGRQFKLIAAGVLIAALCGWHAVSNSRAYHRGYDAAVAVWKPRLEAQTAAYTKAAADAEAAHAARIGVIQRNNERILND